MLIVCTPGADRQRSIVEDDQMEGVTELQKTGGGIVGMPVFVGGAYLW